MATHSLHLVTEMHASVVIVAHDREMTEHTRVMIEVIQMRGD